MRLWGVHKGDACLMGTDPVDVVVPHMAISGNPLRASPTIAKFATNVWCSQQGSLNRHAKRAQIGTNYRDVKGSKRRHKLFSARTPYQKQCASCFGGSLFAIDCVWERTIHEITQAFKIASDLFKIDVKWYLKRSPPDCEIDAFGGIDMEVPIYRTLPDIEERALQKNAWQHRRKQS